MADDNSNGLLTRKEFKDDMRIFKSEIKSDYQELRQEIRYGYVSKDRFRPVEKVVYGLAGAFLLAIVTALAGLIIIGTP